MSEDAGGRVAVLVVNWNTRDLLQDCLRSLLQLPEASDLEIVVVDNASSDGSVTLVEDQFPEVDLIRNKKNEGFARANNQGFQQSKAPWVLLLNSDTRVTAGAIAKCRDYLSSDPEIGVVGCRIANPDGTAQNSIFRFPSLRGVFSTTFFLAQMFPTSPTLNHDRYGLREPRSLTTVEVVMGSFLMVRRSDFEGDLFDDGYFMYAEEADLCRRVRDRGQRVVFTPDVSIVHHKGASSSTALQRAWSHEAKKRSVLRYLRKWHGSGVAYVANLVQLAGVIFRIPGWAFADAADRSRGKEAGRIHKARALPFHLRSLIRPSGMSERFHGPPGAQT